jgi:hypothetical protein
MRACSWVSSQAPQSATDHFHTFQGHSGASYQAARLRLTELQEQRSLQGSSLVGAGHGYVGRGGVRALLRF